MICLIKQAFTALLSFNRSLVTKCVLLNDEPCITRPAVIDLNSVDFNYVCMISLGKCNGHFHAVDEISTKICVPSRIKDVNVKVFITITRINEAERLVKDISCNCKWRFSSAKCNLNQKRNNDTYQCECKRSYL